ncbi:DUF4258 domain-containing protein [Candidatus Wolfebacteria bacterium]|nr:DUF4258 domain-containing protein [Candidatus Wolfebacteria bacterium]
MLTFDFWAVRYKYNEMKIIITDHAKERMVLRKITKGMIETALTSPDRSGIGYQNKLLSFKLFGNRMLKVVYS